MQFHRSNLRAHEANRDWDENGPPTLVTALDGAGFPHQGWKYVVRDVHLRPSAQTKGYVRLVQTDAPQARFYLKVAPRKSKYTYEIDVTPVNGKPSPQEFQRLQELLVNLAAEPNQLPPPPPDGDAEPAAESPPPPPTPSPVDRLRRMRSSFDQLVSFAEDAQAIEDLRAEVRQKLAAAEGQARPLADRVAAAEREYDRLDGERRTLNQLVLNLEQKVAEARARLAAVEQDHAAASASVKALHEKYRPASQEAAQLRDRLAELDQEAEKRRAALGKADDVAALLAALEKLS